MKLFKSVASLLLMLVVMTSFSQCSSSKNLDKKAPAKFGEVYTQSWTAGVKGGGSGVNIYIPIENTTLELDSVYYKGRAVKLETKPNSPNLFIGRFTNKTNAPEDIILSSDPSEEFKNKLPDLPEKIPFELEADECVISYKKDGKMHYYKITDVSKKTQAQYPSAPPNRQ